MTGGATARSPLPFSNGDATLTGPHGLDSVHRVHHCNRMNLQNGASLSCILGRPAGFLGMPPRLTTTGRAFWSR